jgi:hypothetical protein
LFFPPFNILPFFISFILIGSEVRTLNLGANIVC